MNKISPTDRQSQDAPPEHALADYAAALRFEDLGEVAQRRVADLVFDTVGISIGAFVAKQDSGMIAEDMQLERGKDGPVTLWSGRGKALAGPAAVCNGTWAEVLDYQDTIIDARNNGHAGVTIVPACLAVAEREGRSGKDLITAIAAALEVTIAILRCVGRNHRAEGRGFRTTSLAAPLGAAVGCAKLLGLDRTGLLNAMGLAGACAPNGLMPSLSPKNGSFGMDKDWVNGLAAQLAVDSADLAARGMTASDRVVTGERGIAASQAHGDMEPMVAPQGGMPNIECLSLKKSAACYGVHTAMEAARTLMAENGLSPKDVEKVIVRVKADSVQTLAGRTISNHMAARFSLPYAVSSAILRGDSASMHDFDEPAIHDEAVLAYMDRVELQADPDLTRFHEETGGFPAHVEIHAGGKTVDRRIDYPPGSHQRPMTRDELVAKFTELTEGHWPGDRRERVIEALYAIAEADDVRTVTDLF